MKMLATANRLKQQQIEFSESEWILSTSNYLAKAYVFEINLANANRILKI